MANFPTRANEVNGLYGLGCDSTDGTYLTYGPDVNLPKMLRWTRGVNEQIHLFTAADHYET